MRLALKNGLSLPGVGQPLQRTRVGQGGLDSPCKEQGLDRGLDSPCTEQGLDRRGLDSPCNEQGLDRGLDSPCKEQGLDRGGLDSPCKEQGLDRLQFIFCVCFLLILQCILY